MREDLALSSAWHPFLVFTLTSHLFSVQHKVEKERHPGATGDTSSC